jgi:hypothetical protein
MVTSVAFSASGRLLVSADPGTVRLWETATAGEVRRFARLGRQVTCFALAPDGKLLAAGGGKGTIYLWEVGTGKELRPLAGHQGCVTSLAFSDDGKALASASDDTTALVWDVAGLGRGAGRRAAPLPAPKLAAWWADLAGDDAARAYEAVWALAAGDSAPFLKGRLRPVPAAGAEQVARLLADLDSDAFAVRERATRELAKLEEAAEPALRKALAGHPSPEVRRRVTGLLEGLGGRSPYCGA